MFINIKFKGNYPANALSNFYPHEFNFDGFENITCMEAFLQSLKFENIKDQKHILYMNAKDAKKYGSMQNWCEYLYWKGKKIDRFSREYLSLIKSAYHSLFANPHFRQALIASKSKLLFHTLGKTLRKNTVLTWWEFVGILYKLRKEVWQENKQSRSKSLR